MLRGATISARSPHGAALRAAWGEPGTVVEPYDGKLSCTVLRAEAVISALTPTNNYCSCFLDDFF